jgi:hypothetical protein
MTSLITIGVLFIFLLLLTRFLHKRSRGISLSKREVYLAWIVGIVTIVWGMLSIIADYVVPNLALFSVIPPYVEWAVLFSLLTITVILAAWYFWKKRTRIKTNTKIVKGKKEEPVYATDLIKQIQAFINEPPKKRVFFVGTHIDQQWLREKAVNLNQLVVTAKGLVGSNLDMNNFTVNPDFLAQTNVDWHVNPQILPQMDVGWGHLVELAQKLQGEIEVCKRERSVEAGSLIVGKIGNEKSAFKPEEQPQNKRYETFTDCTSDAVLTEKEEQELRNFSETLKRKR